MDGCGKEVVVAIKNSMRDPHKDGTVLCLDCINVNILVMILHYSFARYLGKTGLRVHEVSLYYFLKLYGNL